MAEIFIATTRRDYEKYHTKTGVVAGATDRDHPHYRQGGADAGPVWCREPDHRADHVPTGKDAGHGER